jgi:hypothetical protein
VIHPKAVLALLEALPYRPSHGGGPADGLQIGVSRLVGQGEFHRVVLELSDMEPWQKSLEKF